MKSEPMLTAFDLDCPVCGTDHVRVVQVGYFVNTLLLMCDQEHVSKFSGPTVEDTKPA